MKLTDCLWPSIQSALQPGDRLKSIECWQNISNNSFVQASLHFCWLICSQLLFLIKDMLGMSQNCWIAALEEQRWLWIWSNAEWGMMVGLTRKINQINKHWLTHIFQRSLPSSTLTCWVVMNSSLDKTLVVGFTLNCWSGQTALKFGPQEENTQHSFNDAIQRTEVNPSDCVSPSSLLKHCWCPSAANA